MSFATILLLFFFLVASHCPENALSGDGSQESNQKSLSDHAKEWEKVKKEIMTSNISLTKLESGTNEDDDIMENEWHPGYVDHDDDDVDAHHDYKKILYDGPKADMEAKMNEPPPSPDVFFFSKEGCDASNVAAHEWLDVPNDELIQACKAMRWFRYNYANLRSFKTVFQRKYYYSQGTGFYISQNHLLTARHVVSKFKCINFDEISPQKGRIYDGVHDKCAEDNKVSALYQFSLKSKSPTTTSYDFFAEILGGFFSFPTFDYLSYKFYGNDSIDAAIVYSQFTSKYYLRPVECVSNESVLILGHPKKLTRRSRDIRCKDGVINYQKWNDFLYNGVLTALRARVKWNNGKVLSLHGFAVGSFSGGAVVRASHPLEVCGVMYAASTKHGVQAVSAMHPSLKLKDICPAK